jgi:hypothetical protein
MNPASAKPCRSAATNGPCADGSGDVLPRKPTIEIAGCCARATSGHAAPAAPTIVMNSRRFIVADFTPDVLDASVMTFVAKVQAAALSALSCLPDRRR